jgi:hypothetical protein
MFNEAMHLLPQSFAFASASLLLPGAHAGTAALLLPLLFNFSKKPAAPPVAGFFFWVALL